MTILVVFGIPGNFGVAHGHHVCGNGEDKIYFAEDKGYTDVCDLTLPSATENTLLPVLRHSSGSENYSAQMTWLSGKANYEPLPVGTFSHAGEPFITMKRLLTELQSNATDVSKFVELYSKRMALQLIDNLAAWNALCLVINNPDYIGEREKLITKVSPFLDIDFGDQDIHNPNIGNSCLGEKLEAEATKFC
jgi:hypothetical protein